MDDLGARYIDICLENHRLETTAVRQSCEIRRLYDKNIELRKIIREISYFCPLAVGEYAYLFDDLEDYYYD